MRRRRDLDPGLVARFEDAIIHLEARFPGDRLADDNADSELRRWLDAPDDPLPWTDPSKVTEDEWFFITTLYGEMTVDQQRAHIRRFYPLLFVEVARRDIRGFVPETPEFAGLRSTWMGARLCRMAEILRDRRLTMARYTELLRVQDSVATPEDPMPALDTIVRDHRAEGWKTLSVFVRDCVGGNCFPIDSRVSKELERASLPQDERLLVSLALACERNPRQVARMFYEAGGVP